MNQPSSSINSQSSSLSQNQPQNFTSFIQESKLSPNPNIRNPPSEQQQQPEIKTPKSKRSYKLSKTNPQSLSPSKNKERKLSKSITDKQKNTNQLFGHWNLQQNKKYHWFLQVHFSHFMNRSLRRMDRIFTTMAKFLGTRQAEQCRSHHQKMQKKHKTFAKILLSLRMSHYQIGSEHLLLKDMNQHKVKLIEPLLTQKFLLQNSDSTSIPLTPKSSMSSPEKQHTFEQPNFQVMEKLQFQYEDEQMCMDEQKEEKYDEIEPILNHGEMMGLELESSKNYFYKLELLQGSKSMEQENLLDPDYENNLDLNNFLF